MNIHHAIAIAAFPLLLAAPCVSASPKKKLTPNPQPGFYDDTYQFVFFAVLEGCYRDGLNQTEIDHIIPLDNGHRSLTTNFVLTCPLCSPAYDAFALYAQRQRLASQPFKFSNYKTFGPGVSTDVQKALATPGKSCRDAIQELITKWIDERIARARLDETETEALRTDLAERRKKGEQALTRFQEGSNGDFLKEAYRDWENCPICSGASPMRGSATE